MIIAGIVICLGLLVGAFYPRQTAVAFVIGAALLVAFATVYMWMGT